MKAMNVMDTVEWEPKERWSVLKAMDSEAVILSEEQVAAADDRIVSYLEKYSMEGTVAVEEPITEEHTERLDAEDLIRLRSVDMSAAV